MKLKKEFRFFRLPVCSSTQDAALEYARRFQTPVALLADKQEQGRGRRGREWLSDERNSLTMSLCLPKPQEHLQFCSLLAGAALYLALQNHGDFSRLALKWPNDLGTFRGDKFLKIAGVLVETKGEHLIIGWGLNIDGRAPIAGALTLKDVSLLQDFNKEAFAKELATYFCQMLERIQSEPTFECDLLEFLSNKAMHELWHKKLGKNWEGHTALGLAGDGALLTHNPQGLHALYSGEV